MEIEKYRPTQGDSLGSIAEKFGLNLNELIRFHNANCGITQQIISDELPLYLQYVLINKEKSKGNTQAYLYSKKEVRYRTKQINVVKINNVISAHSTIQAEYKVCINTTSQERRAEVFLVDTVYHFYTNGSEHLNDFLRKTDQVKSHMVYRLNNDGRIAELLNLNEIQENWEICKKILPETKFINETGAATLQKIIEAGDSEYNSSQLLLKNSMANLFNVILFDQYLTVTPNEFTDDTFSTPSHLFPELLLNVHCNTKVKPGGETSFMQHKTGKPGFVDLDYIILQYNKLFKPQIEFAFTDYLYDFQLRSLVSREDGTISEASAEISERIKNNIESQVLYELKKVEL